MVRPCSACHNFHQTFSSPPRPGIDKLWFMVASFIVLKKCATETDLEKNVCLSLNCSTFCFLFDMLGIGFGIKNCPSFLVACMFGLVIVVERSTSIAMSQRSRARNPSMRIPACREIVSDCVELCETEVCFLHIQLTGTNVRLPKMHKIPTEVDFQSSKSPTKSES